MSSAVVSLLTAEELAECKAMFNKFDEDGSGTIDIWELRETLRAMKQVRWVEMMGVAAAN